VPPDYFSATGQLWGNPIYNWDLLKSSGYKWWIERFRAAFGSTILFVSTIFAGSKRIGKCRPRSARDERRWIKGPGADLFSILRQELGELPIIAENLGVITCRGRADPPPVWIPGMATCNLLSAMTRRVPPFDHNYVRNLVAYTGTHDNDTTLGWWNSEGTIDSIRAPQTL